MRILYFLITRCTKVLTKYTKLYYFYLKYTNVFAKFAKVFYVNTNLINPKYVQINHKIKKENFKKRKTFFSSNELLYLKCKIRSLLESIKIVNGTINQIKIIKIIFTNYQRLNFLNSIHNCSNSFYGSFNNIAIVQPFLGISSCANSRWCSCGNYIARF